MASAADTVIVEVEKIVVFLGTLNGEYNGKMLQ